MSILRIHIKIDKLKEMSQYSFSYNYDSLYDAFNTVNRKGKMQKRYLSPEYLAKAQEYREMRKNLNKILRKKKTERTEEETSEVDKLKQLMKDNAQQQKILLQEHLSKVSSRILSSSFRFNLTPDASEDPQKPLYTIGATAEEFFAMQVLYRNSYEKYSNIYKFYEDYRYQRAEKKFKHLVKFDLQSCFDSIYTHTISWATAGGADKVKVLPGYHGSWVGDAFDNLMQSVNARETNGIVIGPEFSRIFAEIILQYIDQKVEQELLGKDLRQKSSYECYRYVDDYFLFYNDEKDRNLFMESLTKWLKEFKLQISPSKTEEFERPFITKVTIAKQRIENLLSNIFSTPLWEEVESKLNTEEEEDTEDEESDKDREILDRKFNIYLSANSVNAQIKAIVKECGIEYRDIANYLLEKTSQRLDAFLNRYEIGFKKYERLMSKEEANKDEVEIHAQRVQRKLTSYLVSLIDVAFFVFNSNRQINTTLKLLKIMNSIIIYGKRHGDFKVNPEVRFQTISKDIIFKKIQDEIALVLATTDSHRNTLHESLYLLILAKELGYSYLLAPEVIKSFIGKSELQYNLFACIILLYYYANHKCYDAQKALLKDEILKKYRLVAESERKRNSELTILTADMMTCPFVDNAYKQSLLTLIGITEMKDQQMIMRFAKKQKYIFTRWTMFNLNKELQAKISQEVYS